jgi:hypothetical protein
VKYKQPWNKQIALIDISGRLSVRLIILMGAGECKRLTGVDAFRD